MKASNAPYPSPPTHPNTMVFPSLLNWLWQASNEVYMNCLTWRWFILWTTEIRTEADFLFYNREVRKSFFYSTELLSLTDINQHLYFSLLII